MKRKLCYWQIGLVLVLNIIGESFCAMTMKQLCNSMDMMRKTCLPKYKGSMEVLEGLRHGVFVDDDKELKCYTLCIAQMAGTITRKNEISLEKTVKQLESMLPADLKEEAIEAVITCKDVQKKYKDLCDKTYFSIKCGYEQNKEKFMFP